MRPTRPATGSFTCKKCGRIIETGKFIAKTKRIHEAICDGPRATKGI